MDGYLKIIKSFICRLAMTILAALSLPLWCAASYAADSLHFVTEPFPPFNYDENGVATGPTVKIVREVCTRIKIECTFEILPWRRAIMLAEQGKANGIFAIINTPDRAKIFYFSTPIVETAYSLYAMDASKFAYRTDGDLAGHTIGVYGPSGTSMTLDELVKAAPGAKVVTEIDTFSALRVLSSGGYGDEGLIFSNRDVTDLAIKSFNIKNLRKVADARKILYCIAFSKKSVDAQLFKRFEETLDIIMKDGTVKAILDKSNLKTPG
jgi:polar amino acid transport system substrate-binding protein